jgi:hypothetical protein
VVRVIVLICKIEDQNLVSFLPLDATSEDSVNTILSHIDNMMQYGEDEEPKVSHCMGLANHRYPKTWTRVSALSFEG